MSEFCKIIQKWEKALIRKFFHWALRYALPSIDLVVMEEDNYASQYPKVQTTHLILHCFDAEKAHSYYDN